jgi:hypothetical protein
MECDFGIGLVCIIRSEEELLGDELIFSSVDINKK